MSFEEDLETQTFEAGADLSTKQYCAVKIDTNGRVVAAGEGDKAIGILQDKPAALGRAGCVGIAGTSKAVAGATVNAGDRVVQDSTSRLVAVGSGDDWSLGVAREGAAVGGIFAMIFQPTGPTV